MFPFLTIAIGLAVLGFGKRVAVLGAAVGALLGLGILHLFSISVTDDPWLALIIPGALAAGGFFMSAAAKAIVNIVLMVLGALGGAAIVLGFLDLFNINGGALDWILALVGGVIGLVLVRRFSDWGLLILAGVVGGLLVTRGLTVWLPVLEGGLGTLLVLVLAGGGIAYQGGFLNKDKATAQA